MDEEPIIATSHYSIIYNIPKATKVKPIPEPIYKKLGRNYFKSECVSLAKDLLGKIIYRRYTDNENEVRTIRCRIVETEAYKAPEDKACRAYNNQKTLRTKPLWYDGGHWYVFTIYMKTNICLNIVCGDKDQPEAVLIRAIEPIEGLEAIKANRKKKLNGKSLSNKQLIELTNGPGKSGQAMGVDNSWSGADFVDGDEEFYVEEEIGYELKNKDVISGPRVNIDYAKEWVNKPWRFYIRGNSYVSKK